MEYMTDSQRFGCIIGFLAFLLLSLGYAWVVLYRLWKLHFHGKSISRGYQMIKLFAWLLLAISVSSITLFFLAVFVRF
jgi:hypothetical protein